MWKYKNWYNDDLNNEESELGVAIFSNDYKIEFTNIFNRKCRYVIPYNVIGPFDFTLFAVWTKKSPFYYDNNIIQALRSQEYSDLIKEKAIVIGDFNTFVKENNDRLENLEKKLDPFINCTKDKTATYYDSSHGYGIDDFCFVSKNIMAIYDIDVDIQSQEKYNEYGNSHKIRNISRYINERCNEGDKVKWKE
jgi:hypothetical protein